MLADQIVISYWRILRLRGIEKEMLTHHRETRRHLDPDAAVVQAFIKNENSVISFRSYFRYESKIEGTYYKALQKLDRLQTLRTKVSENGIRSVLSIQKKISVRQARSRCVGQLGKLRPIVNRPSSPAWYQAHPKSSRPPIYDHAPSPPYVSPYPQSLSDITFRNDTVFQHL
jgi:hypothetical protein